MRKAVFAIGLLLTAGCGEKIVGSSTVTGDYALRTINGSSLPYTIVTTGTPSVEVIDDVITLYHGFTYAETGHSRTTVNGQTVNQNITDAGSYSLFGTSVTLTSGVNGPQRRGLIDGNTMTIAENGKISVFRK